jgi:hypothetical protein
MPVQRFNNIIKALIQYAPEVSYSLQEQFCFNFANGVLKLVQMPIGNAPSNRL